MVVINLVVLGDNGTGKTTLVSKWSAEMMTTSSLLNTRTDCLRKITITTEISGAEVDVRVTDSRDAANLGNDLKFADVVVVVSNCVDKESLANVTKRWIPLVRSSRNQVGMDIPPIIEARNKADLLPEADDTSALVPNTEMKAEDERTAMMCSCMMGESAFRILRVAVENARSPIHVLWRNDTVTPSFSRTLAHLFRSYDADRDGVLNKREIMLCKFEIGTCMGVELDEEGPDGTTDFKQFVGYFKTILRGGEGKRVWTYLRAKGFERDLRFRVRKSVKPQKQFNCVLTTEACQYLASVFDLFDTDNTGGLKPSQLQHALHVCPEYPFSMQEWEATSPDVPEPRVLSKSQWLARWKVQTLCKPVFVAEALRYLGYHEPNPVTIEHCMDKECAVVRVYLAACDESSKERMLDIAREIKSLGCSSISSDGIVTVAAEVAGESRARKPNEDGTHSAAGPPENRAVPAKLPLDAEDIVDVDEKGGFPLRKSETKPRGSPTNRDTKLSENSSSRSLVVATCASQVIDGASLLPNTLTAFDALVLVASSQSLRIAQKIASSMVPPPCTYIVFKTSDAEATIKGLHNAKHSLMLVSDSTSAEELLNALVERTKLRRAIGKGWMTFFSRLLIPVGLICTAFVLGRYGAELASTTSTKIAETISSLGIGKSVQRHPRHKYKQYW
eukprot:CAMPEP_0184500462 /NCGR_PEP_ID=MMETSP0113_2-20130426/44869_1 /TAXON_ID=91329 /ORGANISM="Norrisiella sphaerica, Strain BC52" /LENGTH=674 /DNA_ID=CAMNT_0026888841 /DNA_START=50 /DNA_END=2074 /DNA_ORIENTATION=-